MFPTDRKNTTIAGPHRRGEDGQGRPKIPGDPREEGRSSPWYPFKRAARTRGSVERSAMKHPNVHIILIVLGVAGLPYPQISSATPLTPSTLMPQLSATNSRLATTTLTISRIKPKSEEPCSVASLWNCLKPVWKYGNALNLRNPVVFPLYTAEELNDVCRHIDTMNGCVRKIQDSGCRLMNGALLVEGFHASINFLCTPQGRIDYLDHKDCVTSEASQISIGMCNSTYFKQLTDIQQANNHGHDMIVWRLCGSLGGLTECVAEGVGSHCGGVAADLAYNVTQIFTSPVAQEMSCHQIPAHARGGPHPSSSTVWLITGSCLSCIIILIILYLSCLRYYANGRSYRMVRAGFKPVTAGNSASNIYLQRAPSTSLTVMEQKIVAAKSEAGLKSQGVAVMELKNATEIGAHGSVYRNTIVEEKCELRNGEVVAECAVELKNTDAGEKLGDQFHNTVLKNTIDKEYLEEKNVGLAAKLLRDERLTSLASKSDIELMDKTIETDYVKKAGDKKHYPNNNL